MNYFIIFLIMVCILIVYIVTNYPLQINAYSSLTTPNKVIVFDIDDTLFQTEQTDCNSILVDSQRVSKYAIYIIKFCVKYKYKIAILTARNKIGALMAVPVIKKILDMNGYKYDKYFFKLGHPNSVFQYGYVYNKNDGMDVIRRIYNVEKADMILFDDRDYNIDIVKRNGYITERSCDVGECVCGITKTSLVRGLKKISK